ncbi:MAG: DUF4129 domain-containing protein, partial [Alphaproteobacteria bacterium]|nr:DUF4129 domain-containing protein [Alphaproteobacteria bacterium]
EAVFVEQDIDATVEQVLADEEFGAKGTETRWQVREDLDLERWDLDCSPRERPEVNAACSGGVGSASQTGLMVLLGLVLAVLLFVIVRRVERPSLAGPRSGARPEATEGETLFPEDLPPQLAQEAWAAWTRGQHVLALAMLYKGALIKLVERGLPITDGMTEGEARRLVRRKAPEAVSGVFDRLTRTWQLAAYAHRMPDDASVRALCDDWPGAFEEAP